MANKRNLKDNINYVTGELISECLTYQRFHPELSDERLTEILQEILNFRNEAIARINHIEGKENPQHVKQQFSHIRDNFKKSIELLDRLPDKK